MSVLQIIAEQRLGKKALTAHPRLYQALRQIEQSVKAGKPSETEKARIASLVELCVAYAQESDSDEKENIIRTLEEISENAPLELPTETVDDWETRLNSVDTSFRKAKEASEQRRRKFQKKYFSFRAKAGLQTQEAVARKAGLRRSYVAVIEAGGHFPQQKTLQKLARAFGVDVAELLP